MTRQRLRPEEQIQMRCAAELRKARVEFLHPPNETMGPVQHRAKRKAMGLRKGASDLIIFTPPPFYPDARGAALELKAPGGKPTTEQLDFLEILAGFGWLTGWAAGLEPALAQLREWGYLR